MPRGPRVGIVALLAVVVATACAPAPAPLAPAAAGPAGGTAPGNSAPPVAPKRLTAVVQGNVTLFTTTLAPPGAGGAPPGTQEMEELLMAGLSNTNGEGVLRPQLAEAVPSLTNGLWTLAPDGRMETTWKLRSGAAWHDGTPVTADDLLFTARVGQERALPQFNNPAWAAVERVEALDPATVRVLWHRPFLNADTMFSRARAMPLPRHLLERPYLEDRATFTELPHWGHEFVGTGPFKLRELVNGSHIILEANDRYVLGRPKIDVLEVKITTEASALMTTILAGAAELALGARISVDEARQVRDQWREGRVEFAPTNWLTIYPQFINPNPVVMLDVRFRRAMQHALDRQQLMEAIMYGLTSVADSTVAPDQPDYKDVESAIVRYPYDLNRTAQLMTELGYTRGADGFYRDSSGVRLEVETRATAQLDYQPKTMAAVADMWRRSGVAIDEVVVPNQRVPDREYRQTRPGFEVLGLGNNPDNFQIFHSMHTPLPANNFAGLNRSRYMNPEYDALVDQYFVTISRPERMQVLRDIVRHLSEQVVYIGLFYTTTHSLIGTRVKNLTRRGPNSTDAWNAEQWEV